MNIFINAGDYQSASPKLERATIAFHALPESDAVIQRLVMTMVDEACRDVSLYTPLDQDRNNPIALYSIIQMSLLCILTAY
ncbi:MAG: hypothetical protein IJ899_08885 [Blautia sp.]|nr:hypothetical protein [Blautia sp.]